MGESANQTLSWENRPISATFKAAQVESSKALKLASLACKIMSDSFSAESFILWVSSAGSSRPLPGIGEGERPAWLFSGSHASCSLWESPPPPPLSAWGKQRLELGAFRPLLVSLAVYNMLCCVELTWKWKSQLLYITVSKSAPTHTAPALGTEKRRTPVEHICFSVCVPMGENTKLFWLLSLTMTILGNPGTVSNSLNPGDFLLLWWLVA